jgi:hypothetical protein
MKKDGHICWVAPSSPRCWAVTSSDLAPVMVALGAEYLLAGPAGERVVPAAPARLVRLSRPRRRRVGKVGAGSREQGAGGGGARRSRRRSELAAGGS